METDTQTVWYLHRCEHGAQWCSTSLHGEPTDSRRRTCYFSGCKQGHREQIVKNTTDRHTAAEWFHNPYTAEVTL